MTAQCPAPPSAPAGLHQFFEHAVRATPQRFALIEGNARSSFAEIDACANQLAHALIQRGIGPERLAAIDVASPRARLIAMLGVLKAGGGVLLLDPRESEHRRSAEERQWILDDAAPEIVVVEATNTPQPWVIGRPVICLDADAHEIAAAPETAPAHIPSPESIAVAYFQRTDASELEGTILEHRDLIADWDLVAEWKLTTAPNGRRAGDDASVEVRSYTDLTLLEVVCRGATARIVTTQVDAPQPAAGHDQDHAGAASHAPIDFSLFYFASHDESGSADDRYRLMLESAKFADGHGFSAVWSPERHFHAFGGLSPNPSVMSAALAAQTERVQIRSGSVVLPLHHPIRVAEEWSLVDNISGGRVGLGVASGWFPNDFVMAPDRFENRKDVLFENLETVRKLWRGESVAMENPLGDTVEISIVPPPLQKELPLWVTAAVNPETFRQAAEIGAGVLTHLLGQSLADLEEKIALYRNTWRECGHPGRGSIALMLHTFVGDHEDAVREIVREPMKRYLASSVNLVQAYVSSLPIYDENFEVDLDSLTEEDLDAVMEFSFQRYYETSGLFGTPESCRTRIDHLKEIGVDDVACLIDFGVPTETVLESLPRLHDLLERSNPTPLSTSNESRTASGIRPL